MPVLLLDSTWRPISFIKENRAVVMALMGKVEVITAWEGKKLKTVTKEFEVPAVVRLPKYKHSHYGVPRFRRSVLYSRDNWTCQYCGVACGWSGLTIDHIVPRAHGGQTSWTNCVASCKNCNRNKGCKTLAESGMKLRKQPTAPGPNHFWDARANIESETWHPMWTDFLGENNVPAR